MSIVFLKRDWFDPEGKLWSARNNPHEMDEGLIEHLPSDAIVDGVDPKAEGKKGAKASAKDLKESGEQALAEKEREKKVLDEAESKANDVKHAAVVHKTATPPKL